MRAVLKGVRTHPADAAAVFALLVGSFWLRAGGLAPNSLWLDDAWVVAGVAADSFGDLAMTMAHTPGFTLAEVGLFGLFDKASLAAQALPFMAAVALAPLGYLVCRWIGLGMPPSVVGGVVAMVSPLHVEYATRVKQYTVDALIGLIVVAFVIKALQGRRFVWPAAMVAILGMGVSAVSIVVSGSVLAAAAVVAYSRDRRSAKDWFVPLGTVAAASGVWWLLYLRPTVQEGLYAYWVSFYIDTSGGLTVLVAQSGSRLSSAAASLLGGGRLGWMLIVAALILLAVRRRGIVLILAAPILAAMALSALEALPLGGGRTDIYLLPLLVVLSGAATHELAQSSGGPTIAIGLSAWALVAGLVAWDTVRYPQQDVRGLIEAAEATAQDNSVIIVYPATRFAYVLYTEAPTTFSRSNTEITGFVFTIDDPQVTVLTPHRDDPEGIVRSWMRR